MLQAAAFLVGTAFGSFANVVVYRVPLGKSIIRPGSACPSCGEGIAWYDNLPVVSYLFLRRRCRRCHAEISARYPLVELAVGAVWATMAWRFGISSELPAFLAFGTVLVILSAIDFEHHRLPNSIIGIASLIAALLFIIDAALRSSLSPFVGGLVGALAYGGAILLLALIYPAGMGGGDIKLAAYVGAHLGWIGLAHVLVGWMLAFFLGGVGGIVLLLSGRKGRKDPIPFGPAIALGALIAVWVGPRLLSAWLGI